MTCDSARFNRASAVLLTQVVSFYSPSTSYSGLLQLADFFLYSTIFHRHRFVLYIKFDLTAVFFLQRSRPFSRRIYSNLLRGIFTTRGYHFINDTVKSNFYTKFTTDKCAVSNTGGEIATIWIKSLFTSLKTEIFWS